MNVNENTTTNETATEVVVTKTSTILRMHDEGSTVSEIAKALGIRYQMAYNILKAKNKIESVDQDRSDTKTAKILKMFAEGTEKGKIAKELGISYQFVYNVLKSKGKMSAK